MGFNDLTPEQRSANAKKAWATRKARAARRGVKVGAPMTDEAKERLAARKAAAAPRPAKPAVRRLGRIDPAEFAAALADAIARPAEDVYPAAQHDDMKIMQGKAGSPVRVPAKLNGGCIARGCYLKWAQPAQLAALIETVDPDLIEYRHPADKEGVVKAIFPARIIFALLDSLALARHEFCTMVADSYPRISGGAVSAMIEAAQRPVRSPMDEYRARERNEL